MQSLFVIVIALGAALLPVTSSAQVPQTTQAHADGARAPQAAPGADLAPSPSAYVLGVDDQIFIHVVDVPDISDKPMRVDPNGDLKLPMVGRVRASGVTIEDLEVELRSRLKTFVKDPDVTVTVGELKSQTVTLIGSVGAAGVQQMRGRQTLMEILSTAGGPRADAGPIVRVVRRPEWGPIPLPEATVDPATGSSVVDIEIQPLLNASALEKNIALLPSDVVIVPAAELVYVLGEVGRAGALPLSRSNGVTVMQAVSASGGVLRTAAPNRARVLRVDPITQRRSEMPIDIQKIMQGKATDMALLAGDILVVPDSAGKRVTGRVIETIIQTGITVGTYGLLR